MRLLPLALLATASVAQAQTAPPAYRANCQVCHQATGAGLPGQFPRLAGRVGTIAAKPEGRAYLIDVLLHGMAGKIVVDGKPVMGLMPPFARLSDADIAATLTHAARLGGGKAAAFTPAEVKARRAAGRSMAMVKADRERLTLAGVIP